MVPYFRKLHYELFLEAISGKKFTGEESRPRHGCTHVELSQGFHMAKNINSMYCGEVNRISQTLSSLKNG